MRSSIHFLQLMYYKFSENEPRSVSILLKYVITRNFFVDLQHFIDVSCKHTYKQDICIVQPGRGLAASILRKAV